MALRSPDVVAAAYTLLLLLHFTEPPPLWKGKLAYRFKNEGANTEVPTMLCTYDTPDDFYNALSRKSNNGGVAALVHTSNWSAGIKGNSQQEQQSGVEHLSDRSPWMSTVIQWLDCHW